MSILVLKVVQELSNLGFVLSSAVMKSSKFYIIQVLVVIDCSILLKSHYIIQLLRYVIHAMRKLFEVRTIAAILIFTTHTIDVCRISY